MQRLVTSWVRHPWRWLLAWTAVAGAAAWWLVADRPLGLDTNFASLLPQSLPCVRESRNVARRLGSVDYLYVAIESPVPADNVAFAQDIAARLRALPQIDWVATKEDKSFFRAHRLLYLDTEDLRTIVQRAQARLDYEKRIANPFYVAVDDEKPPSIAVRDILDKYADRLRRWGVRGVLDDSSETGERGRGKDASGDGASVDLRDFIANDDGTLVTVMARPSRPSTDIAFARSLVARVQDLIAQSDPHRNAAMRVEVAGSYRNRFLEYNHIVRDIFSSLALSLSLIVAFIALFFRSARALVMVLLPLVYAMVLTAAVTAATVGRLNLVTALIFAVLLGLGIDFGVHMVARYLRERREKASLDAALAAAVRRTGRAMLTAGLTTAAAFGVLMLARFKGFSEFGFIAAMGTGLCLITYVGMVGPLAVLLDRLGPVRGIKDDAPPATRLAAPRWAGAAGAAAVAVLTAVAVVGATRVSFEYDFRKLGPKKSVSSTIKYGKTLSQSSSPVIALLPTAEAARRVTRYLEERVEKGAAGDLLVNAFSVFSFVPEDQETKLGLLRRLRDIVSEALRSRRLDADARGRLEDLYAWTQAGAITVANLPGWLTAKFTEKDGTVGTMVYLFPKVDEFHADRMGVFYDQYREIRIPGVGTVHPTASGFILVEVIRAVQRDGVLMIVAALVLVWLLLWWDARSWRKAAMMFVPLLVGLVWTAGVMGWIDMRLGLYNMLVLPLLLGMGIDTSVHLLHAYRELGPGSFPQVVRTTGLAVLAALATTAMGFTGMAAVSHRGLASIGTLAILGLAVTFCAQVATMALLVWWRERRGLAESQENR